MSCAWYPSLEERGFGASSGLVSRRRRCGSTPGLRRRRTDDLSCRHVRRRPDRSGAHPATAKSATGRTSATAVSAARSRWRTRRGSTMPDLYDPRRIRLADIDGSGPADIIYLGRDGARLYFNRSGNSLSDALHGRPPRRHGKSRRRAGGRSARHRDRLPRVEFTPAADERQPVRYIDLMAGAADASGRPTHQKPHLLVRADNNLGGSTRSNTRRRRGSTSRTAGRHAMDHASAVSGALRQQRDARDRWRGTAFTSTYTYHHGYFDGVEREFRGFGRVEQVDVEAYGTFLKGERREPLHHRRPDALPAAREDRHLVSHRRRAGSRAHPRPVRRRVLSRAVLAAGLQREAAPGARAAGQT